MLNTARVLIDLSAIRHNLAVVRKLCPHSKVMAMIKADAYGHGILPVAKALTAADGFAVARLDEALQLRRAGIEQRILLLGTLLDSDELHLCSKLNIDVTAHDAESVQLIDIVAAQHPLRVWLELDSGMHRLGLAPDAFENADRQLHNNPGISELLHWTHFSDAEDLRNDINDQQLALLQTSRAQQQSAVSIANSASIIGRADTHADWVRPGLMLYGINPIKKIDPHQLHIAMHVRANVVAIRSIKKGESVGYNRTWTAQRDSIIATIGIGYGDGYPRHARNGTPVWLNGNCVPLAGRVSMDSITVDITDHADIKLGDEAELWGANLSADIVAHHAHTISYELFTGVTARVDRTYKD
ncbi:MAG: alanine racemase [Spongiibacteraceae bacterium]